MTYALLVIMVLNLLVTGMILCVIVLEKWEGEPPGGTGEVGGTSTVDSAVERIANKALDSMKDLYAPPPPMDVVPGSPTGPNGYAPPQPLQSIPDIYQGDPLANVNMYDPTDFTIPDGRIMGSNFRNKQVGRLAPGGGIPGIGSPPDMTGEDYVDGENIHGY